MSTQRLIQQAILDARAGRENSARELFLEAVELDPQNELAWMWLAELLADPKDRQEACRRVLAINPGNRAAQAYLEKLTGEQQSSAQERAARMEQLKAEAGRLAKAKRREEALRLLRLVTAEGAGDADTWKLLARLSPDLDEQVRALEQALTLAPNDLKLVQELKRGRYYQARPLALAKLYEEQGLFEQALAVYRRMGTSAKSTQEWDVIYHNIIRLEARQKDGIKFVRPAVSILRLTAGPPLLYIAMMAIQLGINPFANFDLLIWMGLVLSALGGWLTALASVRSRHRIWRVAFQDENSSGTALARFVLGMVGWLVVLIPHLYLLADSYVRYSSFVIRFP